MFRCILTIGCTCASSEAALIARDGKLVTAAFFLRSLLDELIQLQTTAQTHLESEIAFVITRNSRYISKELAGMKSILHYDLKPKPLETIQDTYYDTLKGLLRRKRAVLRLRHVDHVRLITLKSNPQKLKGRGVERVEIELPWSQASLVKAVERLNLERGRLDQRGFSRLSPKEAMSKYDLQEVQQRRTIRTVRDIVPNGKRSPILAELALDRTTFIFKDSSIRIYEMEIEAKDARSFRPIQKIAGAISLLFPEALQYWAHGKFVTGMAIRDLLKRGELQKYVNKSELRAGAFPLISRTIRSRRL